MPKSERPITEQRRNPNNQAFGYQTFGFRTSLNYCKCSDFGQITSLDHFIYKNYIKWSRLVICPKSERSKACEVDQPNV